MKFILFPIIAVLLVTSCRKFEQEKVVVVRNHLSLRIYIQLKDCQHTLTGLLYCPAITQIQIQPS